MIATAHGSAPSDTHAPPAEMTGFDFHTTLDALLDAFEGEKKQKWMHEWKSTTNSTTIHERALLLHLLGVLSLHIVVGIVKREILRATNPSQHILPFA